MDLKEYQAKAHPGRRVYIMHEGQKVYGTAGNMYGSSGIEYVVRFDFGSIAKVTEETVHLFYFEELH